jgi:hypothetical protein
MESTEKFGFGEFFKKELAKLKDRLLNYMLDTKNIWLLDVMYKECNPDKLHKEDFEMCLDEMLKDKMITKKDISGSRSIYAITDAGKRFLKVGGYFEQYKDDLNRVFKVALDKEKNEKKRDLEIVNLHASIDHFRHTRTISIIALIISGLSFIYLIIKDLILKILN